ncbi:MAG: glycosyltransferase family 39 protein [Verrucomicrobiae bacterium]|nr:glycosyltransferase family 39 protein [Verrucomicrobiae bacterium]
MNPPPPRHGIQTLVHYLEVGSGQVWLRRLVALVVVLLLGIRYQVSEARNFSAPDAMDMAQLGRNLAEGRGYVTGFLRPLSLSLLQSRAVTAGGDPRSVLTQPHPDIENPPVFPALVAGVLRALPESYRYGLPADPFFRRPYAETAISAANLVLLAGVVLLAGSLGRRLFDNTVGFLAAGATLVTETFWQFANAGLPTVLLMALVLMLAHVLVGLDHEASQPSPRGGRLEGFALAAGLLTGIAFMTRYAFGWLAVPVVGFFLWRGGRWRVPLALTVVLTMAMMAAPWLVRTWRLSGNPFGTAIYAVLADTAAFPGDRLERSQHPQMDPNERLAPVRKLIQNTGAILRDEIPRLGGSWLAAFFLVGLLVPFHDPTRNRIRWFVVASLALLTVVQAAVRTSVTGAFGPVTGENLLVTLAPLAFVFGAGLVVMLLDQIEWPALLFRTLTLNVVLLALSIPFLLSCMPPRSVALVDPPYRPGVIREFANFTPPDTLFMSDVPWAVAWYGPRDCLWATLRVEDTAEANINNRREDFFVFSEARRPVRAVYLSPFWADQPMQSRFISDPDFAWGRFYLNVRFNQTIPTGFPLKNILGGSYMVNGHFLAADRDYWNRLDR